MRPPEAIRYLAAGHARGKIVITGLGAALREVAVGWVSFGLWRASATGAPSGLSALTPRPASPPATAVAGAGDG